MSELENLTKSLNSIVNNLMEFLAKGNQAESVLQPQAPKIMKTPDMTYQQFLEKALAGKSSIAVDPKKKPSYRLQEDLELLLELSKIGGQVTNKNFDDIFNKKILQRTA